MSVMALCGVCSLPLLLALLCFMQVLEPTIESGPLAPAVVCIGASQSDAGVNNKLVTLSKANFSPYGVDFVNGGQMGATGRFSNGKLMCDLIAEKLGLPLPLPYNSPKAKGSAVLQGINTASAGSGWLDGTNSNLGELIDGTEQVQWVKQWQQSLVSQVGSHEASEIVKEAVYVINISDNDLIYYLQTPDLQKMYTQKEYIKLVIDTARKNVQDLHGGGARRIAFTSVTARGCAPAVITRSNLTSRSQCVQSVQNFISKYNTEYKAAILDLGNNLKESKFYFADTFSIALDLFLNPKKYGLDHQPSGIACCGTGRFETGPLCMSPQVRTCQNRAEYLFFDGVHHTEVAYRITVDSFIKPLLSRLLN